MRVSLRGSIYCPSQLPRGHLRVNHIAVCLESYVGQISNTDVLSKFAAGAELLSRYENTWAALHKRTEECAKVGEVVDGKIVVLSAYWEKRRNQLSELQEQLEQVPALLVGLDTLTSKLAELDSEHAQKVRDMENTQQLKLKERQKFFEEAFQQDLDQYLSTGYLQIAKGREPIGSMSSMEVNVDMLEQMDLLDMSDQEALDVFLNSGGEDSEISPVLGSNSEPNQGEITLQVPNQDELRLKLSSFTDDNDTPLVQSDEEDVQIDTSLITKNSDFGQNADSDSQ
ncbi:dysbindin-like isoform X5 [Stegostoma tigrinum]|uniref:dysbindin-like isoform X5 n=1 Tax=Stegostoma tigrinum TaxID=3053191 RepID=UPI0028700282|nr:dysbindin-like isoform X5 [Stegostoma tigrinum]